MLQFLEGCAGWITFYVAIGGLLLGLALLGFGIWYLHKYESQLKQDSGHDINKSKETMTKGNLGLPETISALALLAIIAFIFSQHKKE